LGGIFDPGEGGFGEGGEDELDGFGDEDAVPEIEDEVEPVAKRGDVWRLGRHRVMCGDSTVAGDVARLMDGERVDCIVTDPPYGIGIAANPVRQKQEWDNTPADPSFLLQENVPTIIWGGNYFDLPPAKGFLVWDKKQPEDFTLAMCEQAWTNIDTPAKMFRLSVTSYSKQHPTQKPVELLEWCLKYAAGKIVLDPFGGSGSTLIAAENAGRDCRMMELSPRYVDVIIQRWEDYTGGKAELCDGV
ncbi:MAG: site-specific DNA-methyltransferase, partial [Spirulina sp. DLM2.Bin59]